MKVFVAALGTETNTFSPIPTSLSSFEEFCLYRPGEHPSHPLSFAAPTWIARQRASARDWAVVEGTCAFALPAGVTTRATYEALRDEILGQLEDALPVDVVAMSMHGAMVADGYDDCEGDMMRRIRVMVGDNVAVGLELDPHCHLTAQMVDATDAVITFKEYPHTDFLERGEELFDILEGIASGEIKTCSAVYDCQMIGVYHTTDGPMKQFVEEVKALEGKDNVLSVSIVHGFPWGDVRDIGTRILVITNDARSTGEALAKTLGRRLFAMRGETSAKLLSLDACLRRLQFSAAGPIVIADTSDNPGGGAPGDSTYALRELLGREPIRVCLGPLWDPVAVQLCKAAGLGATLQLRVGGKMGPTSGHPLDVKAKVCGLCVYAEQAGEASQRLGDCVAIEVGNVKVVLASLRCQAFSVEVFTNVGINPTDQDVVVVKSSQHFYSGFAPIASEILYADGPGALTQDFRRVPYVKQDRELWPMNDRPALSLHEQ
ncbi:MAG: M81 family metallopeptidase [Pseudomonadota bacterium]